MGYTITVTLDLFCGNKAHRFPYHQQFIQGTNKECLDKARKVGWKLTQSKVFDSKGSNNARCPMCVQGEKVT